MTGANTQSKELRFIFVQMLFALAVAEIARKTYPLLAIWLLNGAAFAGVLPGLAHLFLALIVVASSWVGWANSRASAEQRWSVERTLSRGFVILLVDVVLVVLYFFLISQAENPDSSGSMVKPSALDEALVLTIVFFGYVVWDALTKLGRRPCLGYLGRTWITWVCTFLCFITYAHIACIRSTSGVLLADAVLLCIVMTFRAFKDQPSGRQLPRLGLAFLVVTVILVASLSLFYWL